MPTRWNQWYSDENLEKDPRIRAARPTRSVRKAVNLFLSHGPGRILDLGCGVGRDSFLLAHNGLQVFGADAAPNGVRAASQNGRAMGLPIDFFAADARRLPMPSDSLDGVYCFGMLHEFTGPIWEVDVHYVMGEIRRVLRPGGLLVMTTAAGIPEAGLPHVRLYSREMFLKAVREFRILELDLFDDTGCTGREDYSVWYAVLEKESR